MLGPSRVIPALALATVVVASAQAQPLHEVRVSKTRTSSGLKLSMSLTGFRGSDAEGTTAKLGFGVGGFVRYGSKAFAIQPELWYRQRGAEIDGTDISFKMNYIEIPILFKLWNPLGSMAADKGERMLYLGPAVAFNLSSKLSLDSGAAHLDVDIENTNPVDFGFVFGLDAGWNVTGTKRILLDARFTAGLKQIHHNVSDPGPGDFVDPETGRALELKNWSVDLGLGLEF